MSGTRRAASPACATKRASISKRLSWTRATPRSTSARARRLLEDWDNTLASFVKVTPKDYRRALLELKAERDAAQMAAAE